MKRKKFLGMVLALILAVALLPTGALAAGGPSLSSGAAMLDEGANTASAATVYYGGQTWRVIGYDGTGAAAASGAVTLLASRNCAQDAFDNTSPYGNEYSGSNLQTRVNEVVGQLSSVEQAAVTPRTLTGGSANQGEEGYNDDYIRGDSVENALLWPLSVREANAVADDLRLADPEHTNLATSFWWLRSPGGDDFDAAVVDGGGHVNDLGYYVYISEFGVRPAFYLNLNSVLFTSAAAGGKSSGTVGAGALTAVSAVASDTPNAWTLTLLDPNRSSFVIDRCGITYDSATGVATVPYSGATTGSNEFISAIIKNSSGAITYYGRVAAASAASGTVTVNLSGKLNDGDTLYIFNEQVNSPETAPPDTALPVGTPDTQTDYSSALIAVPLTGGHDWQFAGFTWTGDAASGYTAAVANYTCGNDETHTTTVNATVTPTVTDPTCTEGGKTTYVASVTAEASADGAAHTSDPVEALATDATDHDWEFSGFTWTGDAANGYTAAVANYTCGNDETHTTTVNATVTPTVTDPTCTEGGKTTYVASVTAEASADGAAHTSDPVEALATDAAGHKPGEAVTENVQAPTCTVDGSHDEVVYCTVCEEEISRETVTDAAIGHSWGAWTVTTEPTTTAGGVETRVCANDPSHTETRDIAPLPEIVYTVTSGGNGSWTQESGQTFTIIVKRSVDEAACFGHFTDVQIDGTALVRGTDYTAVSGSTIVTLNASALEKLSAGAHTVTVQFDDGSVSTQLTVKAAETTAEETTPAETTAPETTTAETTAAETTLAQQTAQSTGDSAHPGLWIALAAAGIAVAAVIGGRALAGKRRRA